MIGRNTWTGEDEKGKGVGKMLRDSERRCRNIITYSTDKGANIGLKGLDTVMSFDGPLLRQPCV